MLSCSDSTYSSFMEYSDIWFPNLNIYLKNVPQMIYVGNFGIAFYGIMIATGILLGFMLSAKIAKVNGENPDLVWDFSLPAIFFSICGARIYYVVMSWKSYKDNPISILYLRQGGLAIYGGIIGAFVTLYVYSRVKKVSYFKFGDILIAGLPLGQLIGRWGNFFNREAFGGYCDGLFAMRLPVERVRAWDISPELREHIVDGYIQVHPTFLYECLWNLGLCVFLVLYNKKKKFDGELFLLYVAGYGIGRFWIESLRTDQLFVPGTQIPVSMLVSSVSAVIAIAMIIILRKKNTLKEQ